MKKILLIPSLGLLLLNLRLNMKNTGAPFWQIVLLAAFACLLAEGTASAQNFSARLILGMNGSQIDGDGMSGYYKPGLAAGAGVRFPLSERLSLGPEIMYSMKGSKTSFDEIEKLGAPRVIYRLNYLDFPLVADYFFSRKGQVEAGICYSRFLNARLDNGSNLGFVDISGLFRNSDTQFLIGLKYELFDRIWFSGRFLYSLRSVNGIGLNNPAFQLLGSPSRGGFFNNFLQFTLSAHLFGTPPGPGPAASGNTAPVIQTQP